MLDDRLPGRILVAVDDRGHEAAVLFEDPVSARLFGERHIPHPERRDRLLHHGDEAFEQARVDQVARRLDDRRVKDGVPVRPLRPLLGAAALLDRFEPFETVPQVRHVAVVPSARREDRRRNLEDVAHLHDLRQTSARRETHLVESEGDLLKIGPLHENPLSLPDIERTEGFEADQSLPHHGSRHIETSRDLPLGEQLSIPDDFTGLYQIHQYFKHFSAFWVHAAHLPRSRLAFANTIYTDYPEKNIPWRLDPVKNDDTIFSDELGKPRSTTWLIIEHRL